MPDTTPETEQHIREVLIAVEAHLHDYLSRLPEKRVEVAVWPLFTLVHAGDPTLSCGQILLTVR